MEEDSPRRSIINTEDGGFEQRSRNFASGSRKNQILAALTATVGGFITGTMLGWSSPAIPDMEKRLDFGILTGQDKSWIGSIANLGAVFSGFVAGFLIERIGRKYTMIVVSVPCVLGWIMMALSKNLTMVLVARFITGFSTACFTLVSPVYISEVVQSEVRGILGTAFTLVLVTGILVMFILGAFINWIMLSVFSAIIPVILSICVLFIPETPRYLLSKGRRDEAIRNLMWLRGTHDEQDVEEELGELQRSVHDDMAQTANLRDLFHPSILKPLSISMALMLFQQLGGINAVNFYAVNIFEAAGTTLDANLSSIIIAIVQVIFVGLSGLMVDRCGRRILFMISDSGMAISLAALGLFFFLKDQNNNQVPPNLGWLPLVSLVVFMITYNVFLGSGPWLMMAELIPARVKGLASAIATSFCWLLAFIVTKTFEDLSAAIEPYGCYWLFSGVSAIGVLVGFLFLPETKGKSLEEIQRLFS